MSTTTTEPILTRANIEDVLLAILPILAGPTGTAVINLTGLVPGIPGFVLAVIVASLVKSAIGISAEDHAYEDWLREYYSEQHEKARQTTQVCRAFS